MTADAAEDISRMETQNGPSPKEMLLLKYKQTGDVSVRNEIVMQYMNIVRYAAVSARNMYCGCADPEDIVNEAVMALMSAADSFDPEKGVKFETYASIKVRGAVIDYIRRQDIIPRSVRKFAKEYNSAYSELYTELNREPEDSEIAEKMGISTEKLRSMTAQSSAAQTVSLDEMMSESGFEIPEKPSAEGVWDAEKNLWTEERRAVLADAIRKLNDRERTVITLYYYEKLRLSEIGKVLDISESRVSQIHSKAVAKLRAYTLDYLRG